MHISFLRNQEDFPNFILDGNTINTTDNMKLLGMTMVIMKKRGPFVSSLCLTPSQYLKACTLKIVEGM